MVRNRQRLLRAVRLLDEILDAKVSEGDRDSSRALLVRLKRLRGLLVEELEQPTPNWTAVVLPVLREVVRGVVEWASNIPYLLGLRKSRYRGLHRGTRIGTEILPDENGTETERGREAHRGLVRVSLAG